MIGPDDTEIPRQVWTNTGRLNELEVRIGVMGARLDNHINACTVRFYILIAAMAAGTGIIALVVK